MHIQFDAANAPRDDGGPAFPRPNGTMSESQHGMTLRDWFAGQALVRVYDAGGRYGPEGLKQVAEYSYAMADAMLAERNK